MVDRALSRRALLDCAVLSALLTACGGTGREVATAPTTTAPPTGPTLTHGEYQAAISQIRNGDGARAQRLFGEIVTEGAARDVCKHNVREFYERVQAIVTQVGSLRPPEEIATIQAEFLVAARESVHLVGQAADDCDRGELACGQPVNKRIYGLPSTRRAEDAIAQLEKLGYFVFGN